MWERERHGAIRIRISSQCCDTIWAEAHKAVATHYTPDVSHTHTFKNGLPDDILWKGGRSDTPSPPGFYSFVLV